MPYEGSCSAANPTAQIEQWRRVDDYSLFAHLAPLICSEQLFHHAEWGSLQVNPIPPGKAAKESG